MGDLMLYICHSFDGFLTYFWCPKKRLYSTTLCIHWGVYHLLCEVYIDKLPPLLKEMTCSPALGFLLAPNWNWIGLYCLRLYSYSSIHCTALHCTALHCTALHCTALHCTALHCTALHCTALHCTALHCTALHCRGGGGYRERYKRRRRTEIIVSNMGFIILWIFYFGCLSFICGRKNYLKKPMLKNTRL